ncbi:MAG: zinc ribbon domain-containing protein [Microcoleus sp.]
MEKLPLKIREWECHNCGAYHDRDLNASKKILAALLAVKVCGATVRPEQSKSVKAGAKNLNGRKLQTQIVRFGNPRRFTAGRMSNKFPSKSDPCFQFGYLTCVSYTYRRSLSVRSSNLESHCHRAWECPYPVYLPHLPLNYGFGFKTIYIRTSQAL